MWSICCGANEEGNLSWGRDQGAEGQLTRPEESEPVLTSEAEPWRGECGGLQYARGCKRAIKQGQREGRRRAVGKCSTTHSASLAPHSTHSVTHQCVCCSFLRPAGLSSRCSPANKSISFVLTSVVPHSQSPNVLPLQSHRLRISGSSLIFSSEDV